MTLVTRVSAFFLVTLAVVLVGFSTTLYLLARTHFQRDLDERLMVTLDALSAAADVHSSRVLWTPGTRPPMDAIHAGEVLIRWAVYDERGELVDRCGGAEREELPVAHELIPDVGHTHLSLPSGNGNRWRLAARRLWAGLLKPPAPRGEARGNSALTLVAGSRLEPVEASLRNVALTLIGLSVTLWVLAAIAGRSLCRRALQPLCRMAQSAGSMTPADGGERLPSPGTGDELEALAQSFNGLLGRLHEALERQRQFAGDASHQLRTPLTALIGEIDVARRRVRTVDEYQHVLEQVHGDAIRLRQIVEALLFLARADSQAPMPDLEPIDLSTWLPRHLEHWSTHSRARDLRLDGPPRLPLRVNVHVPLLGQLVDNLLDNACKYSTPGTPIRIHLNLEPGAVLLAVEDQGHGLSPEDLAHVFEPFFRAEVVRLRGEPGVGLGLAVAHRIARAFRGNITVKSEPGRGSRFIVRLPETSDRADFLPAIQTAAF